MGRAGGRARGGMVRARAGARARARAGARARARGLITSYDSTIHFL